ncbi:MAG: hypothetical protein EHM70_19365 [Chloroflexota bacterium]|nr:MAG: hypothetical protein EHM70_19365 [Chloroflexota bacterium]
MDDKTAFPSPQILAGFTADPWESALPVLRFTGPAASAGMKVVRGNQGDQVWPEVVNKADVVVAPRDFPRFTEAYDRVVTLAHQRQIPVVYETDDLLLDVPEEHVSRSVYSDHLIPLFRAVVEADVVTSSTAPLCDTLRLLNPNIRLLPNLLNDSLWSFRDAKAPEMQATPVVIGYMGGETHLPDLELVAPALLRVLEKYGGKVILRFWGGKPPESLLGSAHVEWTALNDLNYTSFAAFFSRQECHIFIAPLQDSFFNRCKSAIKHLEYSTHACPGVYSRIEPYLSVVEDGVNGLLAGSLEEWEGCISRLVDDPSLRRKMGENALKTVQANWLLSQRKDEWLQVYREAQEIARHPRPERDAQLELFMRLLSQVEQRQNELVHTIIKVTDVLKESNARLSAMDAEIHALQNQLDDIHNSRKWQLLTRIQKIQEGITRR